MGHPFSCELKHPKTTSDLLTSLRVARDDLDSFWFVALPPFPQKLVERMGHGEFGFFEDSLLPHLSDHPGCRGPVAWDPGVHEIEPAGMKFSSFLAEE
jgi:hypothetical protein